MRPASSKMFLRLLLRAAVVRRGRALTALLAMAVAAALATALLVLYADIGQKLSGDFSRFGANAVVTATSGFSPDDVEGVKAKLGGNGVVAPSAYAVAKTAAGTDVVVVGVDFAATEQLDSWWSVSRWPSASSQALVGTRAAGTLSSQQPLALEFNAQRLDLIAVSELKTGGDEESRIYISLADFEQWTGLKPTVLEISIPGSPGEISSKIEALSAELPKSMTVRPVRQIMEAETRVLGKTRFILLLSVIAITLTVALCVLATLTASVLERRKDYAVMKALGSSQMTVNAIFLGETLSLAALGAVTGFAIGCGLAMWIGRVNFHAAVEPRLGVFPPVLGGCLAVALVSALVPLTLLQKTEPAAMLKGE